MRLTILPACVLLLLVARIATAAPGDAVPVDTIGIVDASGVEKLVRQQRGEVVVINIWATWCLPCIEEMPALAALSGDPGVRVIGISIDDPEEIASRVIPFLKKRPVPFPILVKAGGKDEAFINALNPDWTGAVPVTFIYTPAGDQHLMLVGKQTVEGLRKGVAAARRR